MRATEKSLMELAGKAEEASEMAAVSARQLPAKLEARTREVILKYYFRVNIVSLRMHYNL